MATKKSLKKPLPKPSYTYNATLDRVVDGDTVFLHVDLGFRVSASIEFRLARINAPEMTGMSRPLGQKARDALTSLLGFSSSLIVVSDKSKDKYGRWIGEIYVKSRETDTTALNVSDWMVHSGNAEPFMDGGVTEAPPLASRRPALRVRT